MAQKFRKAIEFNESLPFVNSLKRRARAREEHGSNLNLSYNTNPNKFSERSFLPYKTELYFFEQKEFSIECIPRNCHNPILLLFNDGSFKLLQFTRSASMRRIAIGASIGALVKWAVLPHPVGLSNPTTKGHGVTNRKETKIFFGDSVDLYEYLHSDCECISELVNQDHYRYGSNDTK